jgi:hypothetical protein
MAVDPNIREQVYEIMSDVLNLPPDFVNYVGVQTWLANSPVFPISQVFGFTQFTAQVDTSGSVSSTSSTTYVDLGGPTLSGLADGKYVLLYGLQSGATSDLAIMAPKVNAVAASDNDALVDSGSNDTTMWAVLKTLSNNGSNTVSMWGRTNSGSSVSFGRRFLIALKYANN